MNAHRPKTILALAILAVGAGWTWHRQSGLNAQRATLASAQMELRETLRACSAAEERTEMLRNEIAGERAQRDTALAAVVVANRDLAEEQSAARWNQPPATSPDWNPASPYVWLRKNSLKRIRVAALEVGGSLTDSLCTLLDIQPAARAAIETVLRRSLTEWRANETALARRSDEHLPQMRANKGEPVTVRVPLQPELSARLRGELDAVVKEQLGEQRAGLFDHFAGGAINSVLGPSRPSGDNRGDSKIYSVQRDGEMFNIAIDAGNERMNVGSPTWRYIIPEHLHPLFEEKLEPR
jgi:hypothetical protein